MVQFLIEEAVFERLEMHETRTRHADVGLPSEVPDPMKAARDFASGRV